MRALLGRLAPETRGLARDSFLLTIGSVVSMAGYMTQIALISHLLGLGEYGILALAISFVDVVNRFFDVRVGDTAIAFAAGKIDGNMRSAAGVLQFSYLIDITTGVVAFVVAVVLAPFVAPHLAGSTATVVFVLYALTLLASTGETTGFSSLRLLGRFGLILRLTVLRELLRVGLVVGALVVFHTLEAVVVALVLVEAVTALLLTLSAASAFNARSDTHSIWKPALDASRAERRPMLGMIFHTNFVGYAKIVSSQAPTLILGAFRPPAEVGAFKIGTAIAAAVGKPADPAWAAIMPRLSRLYGANRVAEIRPLVRQASAIALIVLGLSALLVIVLREPLLRLFGGGAATVGATVLILATCGQLITGVLFWNSPLMYSMRKAGVAAKVYVAAVLVEAPLLVLFAWKWGASGTAAAMLAFTVVLNLMLTVLALRFIEVRQQAVST